MATVTITQVIDDIDGSEGASTIRFSIDRSRYEIDLSEANAEKLYEALSPFISKARKAAGPAAPKRTAVHRTNQAEIREWARSNGFTVSDRGRISKEITELYREAHS